MVADDRQTRNDHLGHALRRQFVRPYVIAHDAVVDFGIDRVAVKEDSGAAGSSLRFALAEASDFVGFARVVGIAQRHEKAAIGDRIRIVVNPAPGIDVDIPGRRRDNLSDMAEIVRKDRGAKTRGERDARIARRAIRARRGLRRARGAAQGAGEEQSAEGGCVRM